MSSGRFDCTEPSLSTSLQGKQGVHGAYELVQGGHGRTTSEIKLMCQNSPHLAISVMKWFDVLEPP